MRGLRAALKEHRHFIIVVTLLTLVMTYPTIEYVFRTDVFALPAEGSKDVYVKLWDIWYGEKIITGKADRNYTDLIFYPEGVSLARHTIFLLHGVVASSLKLLMPLANAFNLARLLLVFSCALAAYIYFSWLFKDKWIALFGAVIFGLGPFATSQGNWPNVGWIAPLPLVIYCLHRGLRERRAGLTVVGGLLAGLSHDASWYFYVVVMITLVLVLAGLALSRWRDRGFWRLLGLLIAAVALSTAIGAVPLLQEVEDLESAMQFYERGEGKFDLVWFIANPDHPVLGGPAKALFEAARAVNYSAVHYLGLLPLMLAVGAPFSNASRRNALAWVCLGLAFAALALGSTLMVDGIEYENIKLPKHYLNQALPFAFEAFQATGLFMPGVILPLAILASFGLRNLQRRYPAAARPGFILLLIAFVAFEYYVPKQMGFSDPITGNPFHKERLAFVDWLKQEEEQEIRLINLPTEFVNSKVYLFYQSLHGFPQTEGGISRPPDSVYDYFRANPVFSIWLEQRPTNCVIQDRAEYLAGMTQLAEDGFTHVIHHYGFYFWQRHIENFRYVDPAYSDDYVGIYRLDDMLKSCPG
ncbi:MAG: hypothetical protein OXN88_16730 [Chloroflexota bacterium]|nr:hypothetical protein [Chloroflexota bacterium]